MVKKLYVGKLSPKTTDQMLFDHFSKAGRVVSASLSKTNNPQTHAGRVPTTYYAGRSQAAQTS